MLAEEIVDKIASRMRMDIKHPVGSIYFDKLSKVTYEIVKNDKRFITIDIPESGLRVKIEADVLEQALKNNTITLVQPVQ